jgi:hypothetical protein
LSVALDLALRVLLSLRERIEVRANLPCRLTMREQYHFAPAM